MEKEPTIEDKLVILFDCIQNWVRLEFITEMEGLSIYAEVGATLYGE